MKEIFSNHAQKKAAFAVCFCAFIAASSNTLSESEIFTKNIAYSCESKKLTQRLQSEEKFHQMLKEALGMVQSLCTTADSIYEKMQADVEPFTHHDMYTKIKKAHDNISVVFNELIVFRKDPDLTQDERALIVAVAEARQKTDRNMHLLRQATQEPEVFESNIDRSGLIALSNLSQNATTELVERI